MQANKIYSIPCTRVRDVRSHIRVRINCQPGPLVLRIIHLANVRRFGRGIN